MQAFYHALTKVCATCQQEKPATAFHIMNASSDGLRPSCKTCRKERDNQPKIIVQRPLFIFSKKCTKCQEEKPIEQFNRSTSAKSGYHVYCRQCQSEQNQRLRIENHEAYRARDHAKNARPETLERRKKRHQERSVTDPQYLETIKQHRQRRRQKKHEEAKIYYPLRRARILNATIGEVNYNRILERDGMFCYICEGVILPNHQIDFDHVIPLVRGGSHVESNIRVTHRACNRRKNDKLLNELTPHDRRGVM